MPHESRRRPPSSAQRWSADVAALEAAPSVRARREPLSVDVVVETALAVVRRDGYEALTMRRLATALDVVPGALYVHVRDRSSLDDLMIARLCGQIRLPRPDPRKWREQLIDLCTQLRDQYLAHPGLARAALTAAPRSLDILRVNEAAIAIVSSGGAPLRTAAWVVDAAFLYVNAYSQVASRRDDERDDQGLAFNRREVVERLSMLPPEQFPISAQHAEVLVSGEGHERFTYTLGLLLDNLEEAPPLRRTQARSDSH